MDLEELTLPGAFYPMLAFCPPSPGCLSHVGQLAGQVNERLEVDVRPLRVASDWTVKPEREAEIPGSLAQPYCEMGVVFECVN